MPTIRGLAVSISVFSHFSLGVLAGCASSVQTAHHSSSARAALSLAADDRMVTIPAGRYVAGSTLEERTAAYDDYEMTAHTDGAREHKWFEREADRHVVELPAFRIDLMPVTQSQYAEYVATGNVPAPSIDEATWKAQGFQQDFATEVARFVWHDGKPPIGREDHPVVLVTWDEARGYCAWRGTEHGLETGASKGARRLPTAAEFEKAARGDSGIAYPWGNAFEPTKLNSAVGGPRDTMPVGTFGAGASPYGVLDVAGNVFQWTSTPWLDANKLTVKGSAWEDYAGVGRGASAHGRAGGARHVIVGFRCASDS